MGFRVQTALDLQVDCMGTEEKIKTKTMINNKKKPHGEMLNQF